MTQLKEASVKTHHQFRGGHRFDSDYRGEFSNSIDQKESEDHLVQGESSSNRCTKKEETDANAMQFLLESHDQRIYKEIINRKYKARVLHNADYGTDKLHLTFPIAEPSLASNSWQLISTRHPYGSPITKGKHIIGSGPESLIIFIYEVHSSRTTRPAYMCALEFNPARIVNPIGIGLCRSNDLRAVMGLVNAKIISYVDPLVEIDEYQVRRIDVTRNFYGISNPAKYFYGIQAVPKPYARIMELISNPITNRPETLIAGTKSAGFIRMYDMNAHNSKIDAGTLRCEIESRQAWCKRYGNIQIFRDLTDENIDRLALDRFKWFGLEANVMTFGTACERILDDKSLSTRFQNGLMKYVLATLRGDDPQVSDRTAQDYRRSLKAMGIGPYLESTIDFSVSHLDLKSGTEVLVA